MEWNRRPRSSKSALLVLIRHNILYLGAAPPQIRNFRTVRIYLIASIQALYKLSHRSRLHPHRRFGHKRGAFRPRSGSPPVLCNPCPYENLQSQPRREFPSYRFREQLPVEPSCRPHEFRCPFQQRPIRVWIPRYRSCPTVSRSPRGPHWFRFRNGTVLSGVHAQRREQTSSPRLGDHGR